jgi:hypothetical protein
VGDGKTDCTAAIQQAIDHRGATAPDGRPATADIFFPAGSYVVTKSLRVTDKAAGGISFTGECIGYFHDSAGSVIVGRTGSAPVFDCAGSQFLCFRRLLILSNAKDATYSTCGLFFARSKASEYAQFCKLEDIGVDLVSDPKANDGKGSVAVCMVACEITTIRDVYLRADTALANLISNYFSIESATPVSTSIISNSCITLDGLCTLAAKHPVGCCWRGENAVNVTMHNLYLQATPVAGLGVAPGLVVEGGFKISASMHVEGPNPVVLAQHGAVSDVTLYWTGGSRNMGPAQNPANNRSGSPIVVSGAPTVYPWGGPGDPDKYMALRRWNIHIVDFDSTWPQVIEFLDPKTGTLVDTALRLGRDVRTLPKGSPTPWKVLWDDGSLPLSNVVRQLTPARVVAGDVAAKRLGGLSTTLHRSTISEALVLNDPQHANKVMKEVGAGCLFVDSGTGKLSYADRQSVVHALY